MKKEDIKYICEVLSDPTLTLTDEFKEWMKIAEHKDVYWKLRTAQDALMISEGNLPDKEHEWQRLVNTLHLEDNLPENNSFVRPERPTIIRKIIRWSVAAIIIAAVGLSVYTFFGDKQIDNRFLVKAIAGDQHILLKSESGDSIIIPSNTQNHIVSKRKVEYQTISTPRGKDYTFFLSDGTEVVLNAESTLKYPTKFEGNKRIVELSGEAFFHVTKDKSKPFYVKTKIAETRVLGTKFNIKAYDYATPHITLVEGKIAIKALTGKKEVILNPGEDAAFISAKSFDIQKVDTQLYTAWTSGYFYFDNASLEYIMTELGRWYNVNVEFSGVDALKYHFSFWANRRNSLQEALDLLKAIDRVKISYKDNTVTVS